MFINRNNLKTTQEIRSTAREYLKGRWGISILICILSWIICDMVISIPEYKVRVSSIVNELSNGLNWGSAWVALKLFNIDIETERKMIVNIGQIIDFIIGGAITFGVSSYFLNVVRKEESNVEDIFSGFQYFGKTFLLQLLTGLFTALWTLLLIIPGIVAMYSYSMSFYILRDNPNLSVLEAIDFSKEMMDGQKMDLFALHLSFIGWILLSILTFGLGFIWLSPYMEMSTAVFYEDLKKSSSIPTGTLSIESKVDLNDEN